MLSDLGSPQSKSNKVGVNKSNTAVSLPGITNAMKNSRTDRKPIKQSYLQTINNISENIDYTDKNTFYLTKQQSKLKDVLKKINNDTLHMIDLIKPKKKVIKTSKEEMATIADRQIDNSKKNISIMQTQIENLELKYNRIVEQQQWQELTNKIREIRLDIEAIKNGNVGIKYNIEKDGKEIVKDYSDGYDNKLPVLESDTSLFNQKLEKLKNDNNRVIQETSKVQLKLKEADEMIRSQGQQYQKIRNAQNVQISNRNMEITLRQRKYQVQAIKKKAQFQNNHNRYKYYKLLKQLEAKKVNFDQISSREDELSKNINISKEQIIKFESLSQKLKKQKLEKNRSVLLFLQKQRKNKVEPNQLKESRVSQDFITSKQLKYQPNVHAFGLRQPAQSKTEQFNQTRKWHKQAHSQLAPEQFKETITHNKQDQIDNHHLIEKKKQDIDHSTPQLKKKQPLLVQKRQTKIKIEDTKNPEITHLQQNIQ